MLTLNVLPPSALFIPWKRRAGRGQYSAKDSESLTNGGRPSFSDKEIVVVAGKGHPPCRKDENSNNIRLYWSKISIILGRHVCVCMPLRDFELVMITSLNFCSKVMSAWFGSFSSLVIYLLWILTFGVHVMSGSLTVCMVVYHCSDPSQLPQEERGRDIFKMMLKS